MNSKLFKSVRMKKAVIILACLVATTLYCKSQFYVGGNIGLNATSGKTENNDNSTKKQSSFSYNLSPQLGFQISPKMDIGAYLVYSHYHSNDNLDPESITNNFSLGFRPFLRYYAYNHNKFSVYGEFAGVYNYNVDKSKYGDVENDDIKTVNMGFIAYPGMSFKISEKVELMALINFFSLGVVHSVEKTGDNKDIDTNFQMGVGLDHILTTGSVNIGAIIRF
jgi:hypothetical protein